MIDWLVGFLKAVFSPEPECGLAVRLNLCKQIAVLEKVAPGSFGDERFALAEEALGIPVTLQLEFGNFMEEHGIEGAEMAEFLADLTEEVARAPDGK